MILFFFIRQRHWFEYHIMSFRLITVIYACPDMRHIGRRRATPRFVEASSLFADSALRHYAAATPAFTYWRHRCLPPAPVTYQIFPRTLFCGLCDYAALSEGGRKCSWRFHYFLPLTISTNAPYPIESLHYEYAEPPLYMPAPENGCSCVAIEHVLP